MLTTILCDMGNVLLRYEPETFLDRCQVHDPQDRGLLRREIFGSPLWPKMDWGELDEAGLESQVLPRLPERLHAVAHNLIFHWDEPILPIPGMADFLQDCKDAGLRLYLLSNASLPIGPVCRAAPCLTAVSSLRFTAVSNPRRRYIILRWRSSGSPPRSASS